MFKYLITSLIVLSSTSVVASPIDDLENLALPYTGNEMSIKGAFSDLINCKSVKWMDKTSRGVKRAKVSCTIDDVKSIDNGIKNHINEMIEYEKRRLTASLKEKETLLKKENQEIKDRIKEIKAIINGRGQENNIEKATKFNNSIAKEVSELTAKYSENTKKLAEIKNALNSQIQNDKILSYKKLLEHSNLVKITVNGEFTISVDGKELRDWVFYSTLSHDDGTIHVYNHTENKDIWPAYTEKDLITDIYYNNNIWNCFTAPKSIVRPILFTSKIYNK